MELSAEELKQLSVAVITSALNARPLPSDDRMEQYGDDFIMLTKDITVADLYRLCSLLADIASSFVETIGDLSLTNANDTMAWLAGQVMETPTRENDS